MGEMMLHEHYCPGPPVHPDGDDSECPYAEWWTVTEGRCIAFDGVPLFTVDGLTDARGYRYIPAELDALTREIAAALNAAGVDGSRVSRG